MFNVPYGVGKTAVSTRAQELGRYTIVLVVTTIPSCQIVRPVTFTSHSALPTDSPFAWTSLCQSRYQMWEDGYQKYQGSREGWRPGISSWTQRKQKRKVSWAGVQVLILPSLLPV